ncbi:ribonuclease inhibitor [Adhaeribacter arboris]|uniref:Ribonuclease inhibitor n=1 Tax=Adhaeribacter arboris TaxID=2072846 RepID=A0A2T2YBB3_9BACT|nr:c-type cytochrome domain-containing protein [Adhaeribacter arboris]PSR52805.1 ribonuclease inhibitor [Adhaeribacter arboris]
MLENLVQFLGRLHPLIVHLPIGILMLAIALQWLVVFPKYARFRDLLPLLWFAGFISAVMACLAGFLLKQDGGYDEEAVDLHQFLGIALTLITGFVFLIQSQRFPQKLLLPGVLLATFFLIGTGHYGGNLTHGEDYLSQPLSALMGQTPVKKVRKPITNLNEAIVYADLVEPVLEQKCYQCHSSKKQKGDLRLDSPESLLKGGEHGKIITVGKADESDLYKRLILPAEDDDRMPPKGKPQLTESEIQLIHWWLDQGRGDFTKKVAEVPQDDKVKILLSSITKGAPSENASTEPSEIPTAKVKLPDASVLQKIKELGVVVSPLTRDNSYIALNMVNAPNFSDADLFLLAKISENIIWLDMSETTITNKGLVHLKKFNNLTRLSLDQTGVSDVGLASIQTLPKLKYLNLYGTKVSDQGLKLLANCKSLKSIYLWQTKVTPQGVAALQKQVGKQVEINFGIDTL